MPNGSSPSWPARRAAGWPCTTATPSRANRAIRTPPYVFLGTNDPKVARRGERADVAPTILARFGLKLAGFKPFDYSKAGVYGDPAWIKKAKNVTFPPLELPPKP